MEMKKVCYVVLTSVFLFCLWLTTGYAQKAIQIQPSSDGTIEASLIEAKVQRGVLTLKVALKNISSQLIEPEIRFGEAYYTDVIAKKKYFALKDSEGKFIAGPASHDWGGGTFKEKIGKNESKIIWIKFPAPPETTKTIDVHIPKVLPFEDIAAVRK
jgi:hypothetical protein